MDINRFTANRIQALMFFRFLLLIFILVVYGFFGNNFGEYFWFLNLTIFLTAYNTLEISQYFFSDNRKPQIYFSPTVITATLVLMIGYGVTNILFLAPWFDLLPLGVLDGEKISNEMSKLVLLAIIASIGLWIGKDCSISKYFFSENFLQLLDKVLPKTNKLRNWALIVILVVSILAKVVQENLGLFGYCSTYDSIMAGRNYSYYFAIFSNFGKLGIIISALSYFHGYKDRRYLLWILIFWLSETTFGVVSGFKTNILAPTLIYFLCYFLSSKNISVKSILIAGFTMVAMYSIALPFVDQYRENVIMSRNINEGTCSSIGSTISVAENINEPHHQSFLGESRAPKYLYSTHDGSQVGKLLARFNYSFIGSYGLIYSDEKIGKLPNNILSDIVLSPIHAWIPRFIWQSKPISNLGIFYNQKILGAKTNSSTGMGPITYLYMGGGVTLVFLGFLIIGMSQQAFFSLIFIEEKIIGKIIFLMLLTNFAFIESAVNSYVLDFFRLIPMWILITHIFYKNSSN